MPPHPTTHRLPTRKEVEEALGDLDFPLDKDTLVQCVADQTSAAGQAVVRQLRAMPLATYESVDEVLRSVDVADQG